MNFSNHVKLAALQVMTVSASTQLSFHLHHPALAVTPAPERQILANRLSLEAIEKSWLAIPRICKAVSFYAQPTPMALKERSVVATSLYESFAV
jgi:hypothetical protein